MRNLNYLPVHEQADSQIDPEDPKGVSSDQLVKILNNNGRAWYDLLQKEPVKTDDGDDDGASSTIDSAGSAVTRSSRSSRNPQEMSAGASFSASLPPDHFAFPPAGASNSSVLVSEANNWPTFHPGAGVPTVVGPRNNNAAVLADASVLQQQQIILQTQPPQQQQLQQLSLQQQQALQQQHQHQQQQLLLQQQQQHQHQQAQQQTQNLIERQLQQRAMQQQHQQHQQQQAQRDQQNVMLERQRQQHLLQRPQQQQLLPDFLQSAQPLGSAPALVAPPGSLVAPPGFQSELQLTAAPAPSPLLLPPVPDAFMLPLAPEAPQAPAKKAVVLRPHSHLPPAAIDRPVPVKKTFWTSVDSQTWQWANADEASVSLAPPLEKHYETTRQTADSEMTRFIGVFPETTKPSLGGPW